MNQLGSLIMVLSGAIVVFSIFLSMLGMSLRTERNLIRLMILELFDQYTGRRGRKRTAVAWARMVLGFWRPIKRKALKLSGIRTQSLALELARHAFYVNAAIISLAVIMLLSLLLMSDMNNVYVVRNSSVDLPFFYRMTALWAGSSGSLLLWYFFLTGFTAIVIYQTRNKLYNRLPVLFLTLGFLQFLFILLGLFFVDAQPFRTYPVEMQAGRGINPLLLHWAMIIHPPILYVGYVSFAIPFAIAISAVISGNMRNDWLPLIRRWAVFSWFFLGFGILLGSKWAYEELGWGGYWAWDPVENSSLMPFLLATAFVHSLIVQERRGMLRFWNVVLITMTYHFCLLGTWITRSGILEGPHTFAESSIGRPLIIYIGLSLLFNLRFLYFRKQQLAPDRQLEAVTSKEGSMLLNNFLMTLATLIILAGVFSPLIPLDCGMTADGFSCHKVEWKISTFNKIMVPVGILTLFLMGASPLLAWRKNAGQVYARTLRTPIIAGILGSIIFALLYGFFFTQAGGPDESTWGPGIIADIFSILTVGIGIFVIVGLFQEFQRGLASRRERFQENRLLAFVRLVLRNKRRYGGYLIHLSIVLLFIGYAGATFKKSARFQFHYYQMEQPPGADYIHYYSGDKAFLENYEIEAMDLFIRPEFQPNANPDDPVDMAISQEAFYIVRKSWQSRATPRRPANVDPLEWAQRPAPVIENVLKFFMGFVPSGRMHTSRNFYPQVHPPSGQVQRSASGVAQRTPTSQPDIRSAWSEDIYIQAGSIFDPATGINPDLNHNFEMFYYSLDKHPEAYIQMFPHSIVATLEVWINPLVKFIWLGTILFFLSGLIIIIPFGEKETKG